MHARIRMCMPVALCRLARFHAWWSLLWAGYLRGALSGAAAADTPLEPEHHTWGEKSASAPPVMFWGRWALAMFDPGSGELWHVD